MKILNIVPRLPQQMPYIFVDAIIKENNQTIHTSYKIIEDSSLVRSGLFTEGGLLENMAQSAAAAMTHNHTEGNATKGYIAGVNKLTIKIKPSAGETIITMVEPLASFGTLRKVKTTVFLKDETIAHAELNLILI